VILSRDTEINPNAIKRSRAIGIVKFEAKVQTRTEIPGNNVANPAASVPKPVQHPNEIIPMKDSRINKYI